MGYLFTSGLDEVLEKDEGLVDVPPVLPAVVHPLPDHLREGKLNMKWITTC